MKVVIEVESGEDFYRVQQNPIGVNFRCGLGRILDSMAHYPSDEPFQVVIAVNGDPAPYENLSYPFVERVLSGAMNDGYQYLLNTGYGGDVVLMDTSCRGPDRRNWVKDYQKLLKKRGVGLCGVSLSPYDSSAFHPHVQSFFMYSSTTILDRCFNDELPYEDGVSMSDTILDQGYALASRTGPICIYRAGDPWDDPTRDLDPYCFLLLNKI
jgi:hypothetical protein